MVLDTVGGAGFEQALKSVRWGAHLLMIGFASGDVPNIKSNILLVKNLTVRLSARHRPRKVASRDQENARCVGRQFCVPAPSERHHSTYSCPVLGSSMNHHIVCLLALDSHVRPCMILSHPPLPLQVHGVYWGSYALHSPRQLRKSLEDSVQWLAQRKIKVPISHRRDL